MCHCIYTIKDIIPAQNCDPLFSQPYTTLSGVRDTRPNHPSARPISSSLIPVSGFTRKLWSYIVTLFCNNNLMEMMLLIKSQCKVLWETNQYICRKIFVIASHSLRYQKHFLPNTPQNKTFCNKVYTNEYALMQNIANRFSNSTDLP